jgi:SAM-dependent methyltransferase
MPEDSDTGELKDNFRKFQENSCYSCGAENMYVFHTMKGVPVHSVVNIPVRQKAIDYPRGDIFLAFCYRCGFISNIAFNPTLLEYSSEYESTQTFSPIFNNFARRLAHRLVNRYSLHNKVMLEIGCGNGEFLNLLCELGNNRGIGFDPAYKKGRLGKEKNERITFKKDYYSEKYTNYRPDFICCRMTLEHIQQTSKFINMIRKSIGSQSDVIVFFQVPNVMRILRDCAIEDIYFEHCSYFSPGSLARLFKRCAFDVLRIETNYDDQYLMIEAKPTDNKSLGVLPIEDDLKILSDYVASFHERYQKKISFWHKRMQALSMKGKRTVIWGSGSKGVAFLTTLRVGDEIKYVVDINPHRQGTFMLGTGQEIVAPEFLERYQPEVVIVMNSIYLQEVHKELRQMNITPDILAV